MFPFAIVLAPLVSFARLFHPSESRLAIIRCQHHNFTYHHSCSVHLHHFITFFRGQISMTLLAVPVQISFTPASQSFELRSHQSVPVLTSDDRAAMPSVPSQTYLFSLGSSYSCSIATSRLLSLPPELLLLIANELTAASTSAAPTLTFCTQCCLPSIFDIGKTSFVAFGLSHPYIGELLMSHKDFGWLYRCWKWLSQRGVAAKGARYDRTRLHGGALSRSVFRVTANVVRCAFDQPDGQANVRAQKKAAKTTIWPSCGCHSGYRWLDNWPTLTVDAREVLGHEYKNPRNQLSMLTTDRWCIWRALVS